MQSGVQLQRETESSIYLHRYTDQYGFTAEVILNARDAMVFAVIKALPDQQLDAVKAMDDFIAIFKKQYGAKSCLSISKELMKKLPKDYLKSTGGVGRFISKDQMKDAVDNIKKKQHVAYHLQKFETGEYRLLSNKELMSRIEELAKFKITESSFVKKDKVYAGQYSAKAEKEKLENPNVIEFAIEYKGEIIATMMEVVFDDKTYDADFIVHSKHRSINKHPKDLTQEEQKDNPRGLAQALIVMVYEHVLKTNPTLQGSWLIAGGYGTLGVGAHLYDEIMPTKILDEKLQNEVGLFLMFGPRGELFLRAANRELKVREDSEFKIEYVNENEKIYVEQALEWVKLSNEPNYSAAPVPTTTISTEEKKTEQKKEEVVGISMFGQPSQMPVQSVALPSLAQENTFVYKGLN